MAAKTSPILTPSQSQGARRQLALSQNQVIAQAGIQAYKLKQFEARGLQIELASLKKLRAFYEAEGVDFDQLEDHVSPPRLAGERDTAPRANMTATARPGFLIAQDLDQVHVDSMLDQMHANDQRIAELIEQGCSPGFFGGLSDETGEAMRELIGTLVESHLLFRRLQGRSLIVPVTDDPKTVGDCLAQMVKESAPFEVFNILASVGNAAPLPTDDINEGED